MSEPLPALCHCTHELADCDGSGSWRCDCSAYDCLVCSVAALPCDGCPNCNPEVRAAYLNTPGAFDA